MTKTQRRKRARWKNLNKTQTKMENGERRERGNKREGRATLMARVIELT